MSEQNSATVLQGEIISQNPAAGASVAPGSAVALVVSSGPESVTVPSVVGQTQTAAADALKQVGLTVGTITRENSATVPAGTVISQNPAA
ncbi:MAG TPA: serine/threonine protein kinase, partial [Candidatus Competibacteraceae bacterium]|nr:serine/threonine protein kinase [Candidatus Competibacteraceae bacterium]